METAKRRSKMKKGGPGAAGRGGSGVHGGDDAAAVGDLKGSEQ